MATKKKGKYEFEVEYRIEAMISVTVRADSEEEAKAMINNEDIEPNFNQYTSIQDSTSNYIGVRNITNGWVKFNNP